MKKRWIAAIIGLIGCNFTAEQTPMMLDNSCADDASCPEGICDGDICIDDSGAAVDVAIEVLRSESDVWGLTPASWAFGAEPAFGSIRRDLALPATWQMTSRPSSAVQRKRAFGRASDTIARTVTGSSR